MWSRAVAVVLGLVAACGDGIAPPDALPAIDGPAGRVTVRYTAGEQAPTVQVLFQNADSSLVLATRTGADGTANAFMAPGGFVTVIQDSSFSKSVYTWADVQPGDELVMGGSFFDPPGSATKAFSVHVPTDPGQSIYTLLSACGSDSLENPGAVSLVTLTNGCAARQDLLVVSRDFSFTNEHYVYRSDALLDGSTVDLPGPWQPFVTGRIEVTGMPAQVRSLNAVTVLLDEGFPIGQTERGGPLDLVGGGGAIDVSIPLPAGIGARVQVTPGFQPDLMSSVRAMHWGPAQPVTRFDLREHPLRVYHEFPTYLRAQHAIRWSEDGPGDPPDAVMAEFSWRTREFEPRSWVIVGPGNAESTIRYPRLPFVDVMPDSDEEVFQPSTLTTFRLDTGGYARVKRTLPITWGSGFPWPIDAASGTVLIQELGSPQFPTE